MKEELQRRKAELAESIDSLSEMNKQRNALKKQLTLLPETPQSSNINTSNINFSNLKIDPPFTGTSQNSNQTTAQIVANTNLSTNTTNYSNYASDAWNASTFTFSKGSNLATSNNTASIANDKLMHDQMQDLETTIAKLDRSNIVHNTVTSNNNNNATGNTNINRNNNHSLAPNSFTFDVTQESVSTFDNNTINTNKSGAMPQQQGYLVNFLQHELKQVKKQREEMMTMQQNQNQTVRQLRKQLALMSVKNETQKLQPIPNSATEKLNYNLNPNELQTDNINVGIKASFTEELENESEMVNTDENTKKQRSKSVNYGTIGNVKFNNIPERDSITTQLASDHARVPLHSSNNNNNNIRKKSSFLKKYQNTTQNEDQSHGELTSLHSNSAHINNLHKNMNAKLIENINSLREQHSKTISELQTAHNEKLLELSKQLENETSIKQKYLNQITSLRHELETKNLESKRQIAKHNEAKYQLTDLQNELKNSQIKHSKHIAKLESSLSNQKLKLNHKEDNISDLKVQISKIGQNRLRMEQKMLHHLSEIKWFRTQYKNFIKFFKQQTADNNEQYNQFSTSVTVALRYLCF